MVVTADHQRKLKERMVLRGRNQAEKLLQDVQEAKKQNCIISSGRSKLTVLPVRSNYVVSPSL